MKDYQDSMTSVKYLVYILLLIPFCTYSQNAIIEEVKTMSSASSPTRIIIHIDSLLFYNSGISKQTELEIKYFQAQAYQDNNNDIKTLEILNEILPNIDKSTDRYVEILLLQSTSNATLENRSLSVEQALKALEQAKINKSNDLIASCYSALSYIYYENKKYTEALSYLLDSEQLDLEQKDSMHLSSTYNNIAIIYKKIGSFDKALTYNQKSLDISIFLKDNLGIGKSYSNIGRVFEVKGDFSIALEYYHKALQHNLDSKISNSIPYRNIGDIYFNNMAFEAAENYYSKALEIETKNKNNRVLSIIYNNLLQIATDQVNFEKAFRYKNKLDSIAKLNLLHENKEKTIALENQQRLFKNKQELDQLIALNTKNRIIFSVVFVLFVLLLLYIFQKHKNTKLKNEQERLRLEQRVLRSQMNPHFIFNALSAIQNSLLDNDPIKSASYLSRFAKLIRQNFDFINKKSILLKDEIDSLRNYMDTQKMRFNNKFDYEINVFADVLIDMDTIPPLILQPFVENAIEHGFKNKKDKGKITITISKKSNQICYEIIDNGAGFVKTEKDVKIHAIDVFTKRLELRGKEEIKSFVIQTTDTGTTVQFCLKP